MTANKQKSNVINKLHSEIETGNIKFLDSFWSNIKETGTPLIENIDGNDQCSLVTFIFKGNEDTESIHVCVPTRIDPNNTEGNYFSEIKLEKLDDTDVWYASCIARNDIRFSYMLILNCSFEKSSEYPEKIINDEFNKNKLIFPDDSETEKDFIIDSVIMPNTEQHVWVKENTDALKGKIQTYKSKSEILKNERNITIYTPSNYNSTNKPYNLLVLNDGSEYLAISAKEVLDNLINDNKIPPTVAVFIDSNDNRMTELMCNDDFSSYVVQEVIPWVRENYNVTTDPSKSVIGGLSLSGLTASFMGLKYSNIFGNILSQSGSYLYKPEDYENPEKRNWMARQFNKSAKLPLKFYLNNGILEIPQIYETNQTLRDVLKSKGYTVTYEEFKGGHDYLSWGETLATGLIALLGK